MSIGAMEQMGQLVVDVQTELVFFALAFATHLFFFHGLKLRPASFAKSQKPEKALSPRNIERTPAGSTLLALKEALRAGELKSAMTLLEALHGLWQKDKSPSNAPHLMMEQLVKLAGKNGALSDLLQRLMKLGLLVNGFDLLLAECVEQGDASTLKEVQQLGRAQGVKFTPSAYQALIKGASAFRSPADARRLMSEAQEVGAADVGTYSAYLSALLELGKKQEVRKVMETMRSAGLQLNSVTFNKLLGVAIASDTGSAWSIIDEMKAFDVKPDQVTCAILLKSRSINSTHANLEKVMTMLDGLHGEMDEVLFSSVVDASVRMGRSDLLMPFLKNQGTSQRIVVKSSHTYGSMIRAYGYVQDIKGAWTTWNEMRRQHIAPISVTLGCMVEAVVSNGDIEGGYELIHDMLQDEKTARLVNAVMYGSIVKGFSHKKCFSRMWEVYDEMVAQKLKFSMVTFNTLIDACARSGELSRIPLLLKDIEAQGLKMGVVTYSAILKGYCQKNLLDEAFELFENMVNTTEFRPDEIMYNTLLDGCARQGLYDRGMELLQRMMDSGVGTSNYTLSVLVKLANRGKKFEKAFELCDELSSKHGFRLNVHVYASLVQACIQYHDLPRAFATFERMLQERVRPDVRIYSLLLRACVEARQPKETDGLLRTATGLSGVHPQLAKYSATAVQPHGGLPSDLISEILWGLMNACSGEHLAAGLLLDLSQLRNLRLDPKLRLRLAGRMADLK